MVSMGGDMKKRRLFYLLIGVFMIFGSYAYAEESCVGCHGNAEKMKELGYPQFVVTGAGIQAQTKMPASCTNCHMGNPQAATKEEAHKGRLTLTAIGAKWNGVTRDKMNKLDLKDWSNLEPRGQKRATQLGPKLAFKGKLADNPDFRLIIYHDRNPETLAFNPEIAEKTCGICHADIVKSFLKSPMGGGKGAHTQSQYLTWTGPEGLNSCGLWVGSLSKPGQDKFTDENIKNFNKHSTMPIPQNAAYNTQRTCNQCHVGCLDCHMNPQKKDHNDISKGPHTFSKKPTTLSCYGGGKSFSCHAGPLDRRRGDGYFRAEFTQATAEGKKILKDKIDIHMQKNITCVECHEPNKKTGYHGDLTRDVNCAKCHSKTVAAHDKGPHKKVDCASCHSALMGGYAFNFWTARGDAGKENPLTRLQEYYVDAIQPTIIKNPRGVWIPVHVVPHTSGNVKADEVKLSKKLLYRNRPDSKIDRLYFSNDSYAITGLVKNLDNTDHDTIAWLNVDRIAHGTGKARTCESCHASTAQKVTTKFEFGPKGKDFLMYKDVEDGEYTILADEKGLRVVDFKGPDGGPMAKGLEPFKDKWDIRGNFALPKIKNKKLYEKVKKEYETGKFMH